MTADAKVPLGIALDQAGLMSVPCAFMRGGTSRGGYFLESDLPAAPVARDAFLLAAYGSPHVHQIDGIGGANALTSKAAIVGPSTRSGIDVEYTFCQVSVDRAKVSRGGTCGNMLSAVGPFALLTGLIKAREDETAIRILLTNTDQIVAATVPTISGAPEFQGTCTLPGVSGTGARIRLTFEDCGASMAQSILPTGNPVDVIDIGDRDIAVSFVDAATPFVFVDAASLGASGTELPAEILANETLAGRLERVRGWAATVLGLVPHAAAANEVTPNVPRVMMVAKPADYETANGTKVRAEQVDVCVRQMAMQKPHRAISVTGSVCCAVAAAIAGTVVAEIVSGVRSMNEAEQVYLGHPSGTTGVAAHIETASNDAIVASATIDRTARLLMVGQIYAQTARVNDLARTLQS